MHLRSMGLAIALSTFAQVASAQQQGTALEEVLVTAQHREESAQSTPISLFTLNEEQLEKQRITGISNLNGLVPNLNIDRFPSNSQTLRLFIRGVGLTDTQITQDAAVGVYLNGAYIARSTGLAFDVADLKRIEVLRGPQGTLYGRNTTGGAIKLITREPDPENLTFEQTLGTGNKGLFTSKTVGNLPIAQDFAAKLAYFYEDAGGYTDNEGPGGDFGDRESKGWRLDLRGDLSETLTLNYSYDKSHTKSYNVPAQAVIKRESSGTDLLSIIGDIASNYIQYSSDRFSTMATTSPLLPTDTAIDGHTLNIQWLLNENLTVRAITAYRELDDSSYLDFSSGSSEGFRINFGAATLGENAGSARLDLPAVRPHLEQEQFSQEFQFLGNLGKSLNYMAGIYYFYENADEDSPLHHIFSAAPFGGGTIYNYGSEFNSIKNDALALFTQLTWTPDIFQEKLHLTFGWRHSQDSREAERSVVDKVVVDQDTAILPLTESIFMAQGDDDYDDDSFTLIAEYDWSDDLNLYAKYSEAYKSGGFNVRDPDEDGFSNGFTEEKLRSGEIGFKGEMLNRRLRFNAALFHQRFDDFQYNFQIPGTIQGTRVFNIDEGEMTGVELELMAMPVRGLFLRLSYAYLDSELDDVVNPLSGELQSSNFTNSPEQNYSVIADYTFPALSFGVLSANASYNFVDERQSSSETVFRDSYDLVNARISLDEIECLGGDLTLAAWGKNLGDSDYEAFTLDNLPQADRAVIWGEGRSYGLELIYRYR
ncbi:MAG: iron complex outermembrane receptor protein [Bacteroidia bacterium]|jgi:iron complex outermembrane receptor protein